MLCSLLALACLFPQQAADVPAIGSGRRQTLELAADDPTLPGRGPGRTLRFAVDFDGRLIVWARAEKADPFLRVLRETTMRDTPNEVEQEGGAERIACAGMVVRKHETVQVTVALGAGQAGALELVLASAPETAVTREAALAARAQTTEVQRLVGLGEFEPARKTAAAALDALAAAEGSATSVACGEAARSLAYAAGSAAAPDVARAAWERVIALHTGLYPPDHEQTLRQVEEAGRAMAAVGELALARELLARVLAVRAARLPADDDLVLRVRDSLADVLADSGDGEGARAQLEQVLRARRAQHPEDHSTVRRARARLAVVLQRAEAAR
jgi:hypothetical protein